MPSGTCILLISEVSTLSFSHPPHVFYYYPSLCASGSVAPCSTSGTTHMLMLYYCEHGLTRQESKTWWAPMLLRGVPTLQQVRHSGDLEGLRDFQFPRVSGDMLEGQLLPPPPVLMPPRACRRPRTTPQVLHSPHSTTGSRSHSRRSLPLQHKRRTALSRFFR